MAVDSSDPTPGVRPAELFARCLPGLGLALLLSFCISLTMFAPPLYMMKLFSGAAVSGSAATVAGLTALALGAVVLFAVLDYLRSRTYLCLSAWLAERLGDAAPEPMAEGTLRGTGTAADILKDIALLRELVASGGLTAGLDLVCTPMFFFALFLLHPYFGWLGLAAAASLALLAVLNDVAARRTSEETARRTEQAYREVGEALKHVEAVEAMGLLDTVAARWRRAHRAMIAAAITGAGRHALASSLARGLRMGLQLAVFGGGMILVLDQETPIGALLAASLILTRALAPLEQLIDRWRQWGAGLAAARRLHDALSEPPRIARGRIALPRPSRALDLDRVIYVPDGMASPVLNGISLRAEAGTITGLAGAAAAGKSTLMQLMAGIWQPTAGAVTLDGHHVSAWPRGDFGLHAGYLPQSVQLFGPSIGAAIARLGPADADTLIRAATEAGIHEQIGRLPQGYDTPLAACGHLLSGGQRQQLGLARAYFGDPALLLLDEPDASLDQAALRQLARSLREFADAGRIVLFSSHRPEILRIADRVILLDRGAVANMVEPGTLPVQRNAVPAATEAAEATVS